jgi:predicted small integral membrane protein
MNYKASRFILFLIIVLMLGSLESCRSHRDANNPRKGFFRVKKHAQPIGRNIIIKNKK